VAVDSAQTKQSNQSGWIGRGWVVVLAGLGINLALGVLYAWSVIAKQLTASVSDGGWGWSGGEASFPYAVAVGVFALTMVFAGRAQDRLGPRVVAMAGGALAGLGILVASFGSAQNSLPIVAGFGVMTGLGIGLGYAAVTPAAVKWFPKERRGLITGIVVGGFGLASVYIAPLTTWLLSSYGVDGTFRALGVAFMFGTVALASLLSNPTAEDLEVLAQAEAAKTAVDNGEPEAGECATVVEIAPEVYVCRDLDWHEMIRQPQFYALWVMYAFSAFAGLMVIGHMAKIAEAQLNGTSLGFMLVAVLAVGNFAGRIVAGMVSDRIGGMRTKLGVFLGQALAMALLWQSGTVLLLIVAAALVGFLYGANLSVFPSTTAHFFGTKNLGVNYGLLFTAWGFGGVFGSMAAGAIVDMTGTYAAAYAIAAVLSVAAAGLALVTKEPSH